MPNAAGTLTNPDAGVMVARPATMPDAAPSTLGLPFNSHSRTVQLNAAAAAEKCVDANALAASVPALKALPALKPNQPTHNNPAPMREYTTLCGIIGSRGQPSRRPSTSAQTRADTPELMCTTVPPAKSSTGILPPNAQLNSPPLPHIMWHNGKYTNVVHSTINARYALKRMRSATAPLMSAGVMMANIIWNSMKVCAGIVPE